ncbi:MAG: AAA family ATPase [Alphaproteobacteria bacterium]|nr:AAA family ATPase [Alphaproteobacteria bacterium]
MMLKELDIKNFKNIKEEHFELSGLTIFTGVNSSGKSSVLQSILLLSKKYSLQQNADLSRYTSFFSKFSEVKNKYIKEDIITIVAISEEDEKYNYNISPQRIEEADYSILKKLAPTIKESILTKKNKQNDAFLEYIERIANMTRNIFSYEDNLYYLSANRNGPEDISQINHEKKVGINGEYLIGYLAQNKLKNVDVAIQKFKDNATLAYQVGEWLKDILEIDISANLDMIDDMHAKLSFDIEGVTKLNPLNVGSGNSYLLKLLILCLSCVKGNIVIIENPEIHLHPKAQAKLGEFFSFLAENGVQIILETHSEHLINKVRFQVKKNKISNKKIHIYYKKSIKDSFSAIDIDDTGHFVDKENKRIPFPTGFFDTSLENLMEIG